MEETEVAAVVSSRGSTHLHASKWLLARPGATRSVGIAGLFPWPQEMGGVVRSHPQAR